MSIITAESLPWFRAFLDTAPRSRDLMASFKMFIAVAAAEIATGLGGPRREADYLHAIRGWKPNEIMAFADVLGQLLIDMRENPYADLLGPAYEYLEGKGNKKLTASYYTPDSLSRLTAKITTADELAWPLRGPLLIDEPAAGSGAMLLRLVQSLREDMGAPSQAFRIRTCDVNKLACDMAYINLTMHAVPAEIIHGDTLRLQAHASWRNLWYYAAHGWQREEAEAPASALERAVQAAPMPTTPVPDFGPLFGGLS